MNKINITTTQEFKEDFACFGFEEFVRKVVFKCADKKEHGLVGTITLYEAEPSKRIYFKNEDDEDFIVRYFIQWQNQNEWKASYILFKMILNENDSEQREEISCSTAKARYVS